MPIPLVRLSVFSSLSLYFLLLIGTPSLAQTGVWMKYEKTFESSKRYTNPLYDLQAFEVEFLAPSGRTKTISGFWDGGSSWKVRFAPDEVGTWLFRSRCSDTLNTGLHNVVGQFDCTDRKSPLAIYSKGSIIHPKGAYYLTHADGSPFFFAACTAWNGALKSTEAEWDTYLQDRVKNQYTVIQFAATQWRGCATNSEGQVAFEGSGRIQLNPAFFQHLDKKIDAINQRGLVAAPVLLWALPVAEGRELSPGYYLPDNEAILLANYMVARYGGNQVIWILGGDGKYVQEYEQRWKTIGRAVFGREHPGTVALHPQGRSWIGKEYAHENWLDIIGYQTGHNSSPSTIRWTTTGPVTTEWGSLPPKVVINMEPVYERISPNLIDKDVRNASYWSLFSTPVAGITYGAGGIWPWLRTGESILNHGKSDGLPTWDECLKLPGSRQIGLLSHFMRQHNWWQLKPAPGLLADQPGQTAPDQYISVVQSDDRQTIMVYVPVATRVLLYNPLRQEYTGQWYDPTTDRTSAAVLENESGTLRIKSAASGDKILILTLKP
ncbi:apiosidase-like domain-containing protein [Spirosoma koreense]